MLVLGIETSCDETGVAVYDPDARRLLAHAVHSQMDMHEAYGGVVPELASRDHIRRLVPLTRGVMKASNKELSALGAIGYTAGPGLAGALLVGASFAEGLAHALGIPAIGIHHLEGHLLSPLLSARPPAFPFVALLVSGGHTQLMRVDRPGAYRMLGETQDDAAGEAFDKTAQLLGLGYPGGPAVSALAERGVPGRYRLPRPMLSSGLDFSFSGLKTAVLTLVQQELRGAGADIEEATRADIARSFVDAVVDVLAAKCLRALEATALTRLVVAGGVGANRQLRAALDAQAKRAGFDVHYPEPALCTDNGAMIAYAASLRLPAAASLRLPAAASLRLPASAALAPERRPASFDVRPRWPLDAIS